MTLLIAWMLLFVNGYTHPVLYIGAAALWVAHLLWHSTATNKLL